LTHLIHAFKFGSTILNLLVQLELRHVSIGPETTEHLGLDC